jgi:hypothetical protein
MKACLFLTVSALLATPAARAFEEPRPSLFHQVIKQPTGRNGYEEFVRAVDVLRESKLYNAAEMPGLEARTLSVRRRTLSDPPVKEALRLLRVGVQKPVLAPPNELDPDAPYPQSAGFRRIGRLLRVQHYVLLADGRVLEALESVRLGVRFARAIQTGRPLAAFTGSAIEATLLEPLGAHLSQLSASHCEQLFRLCSELARHKAPLERLAQRSLADDLKAIAELRKEGREAFGDPDDDDEGEIGLAERRAARERFPADPAEQARMWAETERRIKEIYQRILADVGKPIWQRQLGPFRDDGTPAAAMVRYLGPHQFFSLVDETYGGSEARFKLLACHAAVLRHRWEKDVLPPTLAALNLGALATDPFTGQPFRYEVTGTRYRLYSAGPEKDEPDNPRILNGRLPITVVPGEP